MNEHNLDSLVAGLWAESQRPQAFWQIAVLTVCVLLSWAVTHWLRGRFRRGARRFVAANGEHGAAQLRNVRGLGEILFPALVWLTTFIVERVAAQWHQPVALLRVALVLAFSFVLIRLVVHALQRVFSPSGPLAAFERVLALLVWSGVALHVLGLLPAIVDAFDGVEFPIGKSHITLLQVLQGVFTVAATLVVALWAGASIEARLMNATSLDNNLRVVAARFVRALLIVVAVLASLSMVGIDLTVLSVFGGALGVGLGLGLQRIASSYVSGFIILLDRSLRIGDLISVDKFYGTVSQIRTRYTVVKSLDGTEAIIPNELLVSQAVQNHSYSDKRVRVAVKVQVGYDSDVERALAVLVECTAAHPRALTDPPPGAYVTGFAADGIDLEVGFWVIDPEQGTLGARSDISLAILRAFRAEGITIPFPQRDVRVWLPEGLPTAGAAPVPPDAEKILPGNDSAS